MAQTVFPTKGNLLAVKKSLALAKTGFELLDRKRNILVRETMALIDIANEIQSAIDSTYSSAYQALQMANITLGIVDDIAMSVPLDDGVTVDYRSVMGVEIPILCYECTVNENAYGYDRTNSMLDEAFKRFEDVKRLTVRLAEIENSVYRLADGIKKTQKRANALKNIIIPRFEETVKFITGALEEKEREEFSRLKVIKRAKEKQTAAN
ncbi:MAG: V-type ATP synthase subunit D [Clostridiales bacterium 43-6]|nr:MAG: V-type ATP synthase subunit D [Clostridiales bacterium 43-6]